MLYYQAAWQEMVASLPPAEQIELLGDFLLATASPDDSTADAAT